MSWKVMSIIVYMGGSSIDSGGGGVTTHKWALLIYIALKSLLFFLNLKYLISCQFNIKREIFNISFVCKNSDLSSCKQMK